MKSTMMIIWAFLLGGMVGLDVLVLLYHWGVFRPYGYGP